MRADTNLRIYILIFHWVYGMIYSIIGQYAKEEKPAWKGGERMSLEAIHQITESEQAAQACRAEAEAEAKRLAAEAQQSGRERLEAARAAAEAEAAGLLTQAEAQGAAREEELLAENQRERDALAAQAKERLDLAAELIVRRVVNT